MIAIALIAAVQGPLPPPVAVGFLPPMSFSCQLDTGGRKVALSGRISPVRFDVAPGLNLMRTSDGNGNFNDGLRVEIADSPLDGLAGAYEVIAISPSAIDKMTFQVPPKASSGYVLTLYSPKSGTGGYPEFTHMLIERRRAWGRTPAAGPSVWFTACTTALPRRADSK